MSHYPTSLRKSDDEGGRLEKSSNQKNHHGLCPHKPPYYSWSVKTDRMISQSPYRRLWEDKPWIVTLHTSVICTPARWPGPKAGVVRMRVGAFLDLDFFGTFFVKEKSTKEVKWRIQWMITSRDLSQKVLPSGNSADINSSKVSSVKADRMISQSPYRRLCEEIWSVKTQTMGKDIKKDCQFLNSLSLINKAIAYKYFFTSV